MAIIYSMLSVISGALLDHVADNGDLGAAGGSVAQMPWGLLHIQLSPSEVSNLPAGVVSWVIINCSSSESMHQAQLAPSISPTMEYNNHTGYVITVTSSNPNVALPYSEEDWSDDNRTDRIVFSLQHNQHSVFAVSAHNVGHAIFLIQVSLSSVTPDNIPVISQMEYPVTVIRKLRLVDLVFDCAMAAIALLNSFSLGCLTKWCSLRQHLGQPNALLLTACCHFVLMPMVSFLGKHW